MPLLPSLNWMLLRLLTEVVLPFTQEAGGTVGLASVTFQDEGVLTSKTVTNTVYGNSGSAASPMAADLTAYDAAGTHVQTAGTIQKLDNAITGVNTARADYGANISRLSHTIDNLEVGYRKYCSCEECGYGC